MVAACTQTSLTWQNVDKTILELVDWQVGTDEAVWTGFHIGKSL